MSDNSTSAEVKRLLNRRDADVTGSESSDLVSNRNLADELIAYGNAQQAPLSIVNAVQILDANPAVIVAGSKTSWAKTRQKLLNDATKLAGDDSLLKKIIDRLRTTAPATDQSSNRVTASVWKVVVEPRKFVRLKPDPVFVPQTKAMVTAVSSDANVMIGMTVRAVDQKSKRKAAGRGRIQLAWNPGLKKRRWDVRIFNLNGTKPLPIRVESA